MTPPASASGPEWSLALYRCYRSTMPAEVRAAREVFAARQEWGVLAAGVLDWAMEGKLLTGEHRVQAMRQAQAGLFGRSSAYYERRLSIYRPPLGPLVTRG